MTEQHGRRTAKDLLLKMLEIINTQSWDELDKVVDPDIINDWPQSNERVVGAKNLRHIFDEYPGGGIQNSSREMRFVQGGDEDYLLTPMFTVVRTEGSGDSATGIVTARYPDGSDWHVINIAKARDGRLVHMTQYYAPAYEAPKWRAKWVQPLEEEK